MYKIMTTDLKLDLPPSGSFSLSSICRVDIHAWFILHVHVYVCTIRDAGFTLGINYKLHNIIFVNSKGQIAGMDLRVLCFSSDMQYTCNARTNSSSTHFSHNQLFINI